MKKIKDPNLRIEVQSLWDKYDLQTNQQFNLNLREKAGKKAWIRKRLIFALKEIVKPNAGALTSAQKLEFFDKIGQYTFSGTISLKNFVIKDVLEKAIKDTKWGKRQKLFGEFK